MEIDGNIHGDYIERYMIFNVIRLYRRFDGEPNKHKVINHLYKQNYGSINTIKRHITVLLNEGDIGIENNGHLWRK